MLDSALFPLLADRGDLRGLLVSFRTIWMLLLLMGSIIAIVTGETEEACRMGGNCQ